MSQYSEIMGSFIRNGDYPLEANYVFDSEAALQEFYKDQVNATTLHPGLFKVVTGDEQQLYWVVKNGDSLEFKPFLKEVLDNQQTLKNTISELNNSIEDEISDRKEAINNLNSNLGNLNSRISELNGNIVSLDTRVTNLENDWYEEV